MENKTSFSLFNFGKNNTPGMWQKVGDTCLILAGCSTLVASLPLSAGVVATISSYLAVAGVMGKIITKFTGSSLPEQK